MAVLFIFLTAVILVYCAFIMYIGSHFNTQAPAGVKVILPRISILIPARNEERQISACLKAIQQQDCEMDNVEVIVIDDFSDDGTVQQAKQFQGLPDLKVLGSKSPGKKQALLTGIEAASGDVILTTDADCFMGRNWISLMAGEFMNKDLHMLCGLVRLEGRGLFQRLQQTESASIVGISAVMLNRGMPCTCNGASLMFRKDVFMQLGGYAHPGISSGDDDLLMQQFARLNMGRTRYLMQAGSVVETEACHDLAGFIRQRRRWMSKTKAYLFPYNKWIQMLVLLHLLAFYCLCVMLFTSFGLYAAILLGVKYLAEFSYGSRLRKLIPFHAAMIFLMPFYQLYMVFLPVYALFSRGEWKGRHINF